MSLRLCTRCAGSHLRRCMLSDLRPRLTPFSSLHTSFILRHESTQSEDLEDALNSSQTTAKARARAWYLDDPNTSSSSDPTTSSSTDPSELPYPSPLPMTVSSFTTEPTQPPPIPKSSTDTETRQPQFTTFDPSRTTALPPTRSIVPLPPNTPDYLRPLHAYLTSDQAAEVLDPSSVVFLHTPSAPIWSVGPGELIRGETEAGARWEWVVVLEVKGTGKGVVGRAERAIRLWVGPALHITQNPD